MQPNIRGSSTGVRDQIGFRLPHFPKSLSAMLVGAWLLLGLEPGTADALQITGLSAPQSFVSDAAGEQYFISNVNGEPNEKDNNGFITKLDSAGKLVKLEFIHGGDGRTVLHAPKGLVVVDQLLYVADLDTVRAFDTQTGKPVHTVSFRQFGDVGLSDLVYDGHGLLYASDTEANTIYKIEPGRQHAISLFVKDPTLAGPRGLAVHPHSGHLIVASWKKGKILEVDAHAKIVELVSNSFFTSRFGNLDGVDFDTFGNMYVADTTGGKVWRMRADRKFDVIAEFLNSPADISVDRKKHLILVPYAYGNAAEMNGLESPLKEQKQKRTLADYGFGSMDKFKQQQKDKEREGATEGESGAMPQGNKSAK
jgi:hypothetical protein